MYVVSNKLDCTVPEYNGSWMRCEWSNENSPSCVIRLRPISEMWDRRKGELKSSSVLPALNEEPVKKKKLDRKTAAVTLEGEDRIFLTDFVSINFLNMVVQGLRGVKKTEVRLHQDGGYVVDALLERKSSCMAKVFGLPFVDFTRTTTNDMTEALNVGGIEMARHVYQHELKMVFGAYGIKISDKHLDLVSDVVTWMGFLTKFTRHGIAKIDAKILMRASFEQSTEVLHEAARYTQLDDTNDITSAIITGKIPNVGTGKFDVMFDMDALERYSKPTVDVTVQSIKNKEDFVDTAAPCDRFQDLFSPNSASSEAEYRLRTLIDEMQFMPSTPPPIEYELI